MSFLSVRLYINVKWFYIVCFSHLQNFELKDTANSMHIHSFGPWTSHGKIDVELRGTSASIFTDGVSSLLVPCGPHTGDTANSQEQSLVAESDYIPTQVHEDILARMIQSHKTGDFCLVGEKVCMSV